MSKNKLPNVKEIELISTCDKVLILKYYYINKYILSIIVIVVNDAFIIRMLSHMCHGTNFIHIVEYILRFYN